MIILACQSDSFLMQCNYEHMSRQDIIFAENPVANSSMFIVSLNEIVSILPLKKYSEVLTKAYFCLSYNDSWVLQI